MIVPTLNEARRLPRLLARLTEPGGDRPDAIVVVDGGSLDGTCELARSVGGVQLVELGSACRGAQLARGARAADAELLLFLHADCVPGAGALDRLRETFADPRVAATGFAQRLDGAGAFFRALERWRAARIGRGSVYGDSGLAVRAALYRELGGHRPWPLCEDLELSKRIVQRGRIARVPDAVLHVDTRRWRALGPLRTTFRNRMLYLGYRLGVPPERLARAYADGASAHVHAGRRDPPPSHSPSERP